MASSVGDKLSPRPGTAEDGPGAPPAHPLHPADIAEDAARRAVEGVGITVRPRHRWARRICLAGLVATVLVLCVLLGRSGIGPYP